MRSLVFMTAAVMVWLGSSSTLAQVGSTSATNAPAMRTTSPAAVPGTIPTVGASPPSPLGANQFMPGTPATISGGAIGAVASVVLAAELHAPVVTDVPKEEMAGGVALISGRTTTPSSSLRAYAPHSITWRMRNLWAEVRKRYASFSPDTSALRKAHNCGTRSRR